MSDGAGTWESNTEVPVVDGSSALGFSVEDLGMSPPKLNTGRLGLEVGVVVGVVVVDVVGAGTVVVEECEGLDAPGLKALDDIGLLGGGSVAFDGDVLDEPKAKVEDIDGLNGDAWFKRLGPPKV